MGKDIKWTSSRLQWKISPTVKLWVVLWCNCNISSTLVCLTMQNHTELWNLYPIKQPAQMSNIIFTYILSVINNVWFFLLNKLAFIPLLIQFGESQGKGWGTWQCSFSPLVTSNSLYHLIYFQQNQKQHVCSLENTRPVNYNCVHASTLMQPSMYIWLLLFNFVMAF